MTEKLIGHRVPAPSPQSPPYRGMTTTATVRPDHDAGRLALIIGPAIGFALAACLAISFALALAGGAGEAALGSGHAVRPVRSAVFVL
ncbi:hypothetical protein [Acidiphilium sp.]|uniref:hypothetical protein n=1 Tax=Acidiphilium sp. TaxID=527 RepID=UPI003D0218B5